MPARTLTDTRLAVVAYPTLEAADRSWIDTIRAGHDPQAPAIEAHVTLLFPCRAARRLVEAALASAASATGPIEFSLDHAAAVADARGPGGHVFLVVGRGAGAITSLHHRLYAGELRRHLPPEIPYVPHITVGAADHEACGKLASSLKRHFRPMTGTIAQLDIVSIRRRTIESIASVPLFPPEHTTR